MGSVTVGNNNYVCLTPDSVEEGEQIFTGLTDGGNVEMPYNRQSWGDYFGSGADKFGVRWMVDIADPEAQTPA
jgi:PhnB protein